MSGAVTAISIVGALATTAFAVDTIATVGLISIGGALAATAAVGATLGAIGQVTGSKELKIAGTVLGVVGGVGSLANSFGAFGAASDFFGGGAAAGGAGSFGPSAVGELGLPSEGASAAATGGTDAGTWAGVGAQAAPQAASGGATNIVDSLAGSVTSPTAEAQSLLATAAESPDVAPAAATDVAAGARTASFEIPGTEGIAATPQTTGAGSAPFQIPGTAGSAPGVDSFGTPVAPEVPQANVNGIVSPQQGSNLIPGFGGQGDDPISAVNPPATQTVDPLAKVTGQNTSVGATTPGTTAPSTTSGSSVLNGSSDALKGFGSGTMNMSGSSSTDIWSKLFDFATSNSGKLALGALQAGGSFLSGALSPLPPAQVKALDAQATANQAAANLSNTQAAIASRQLSNMSQPIPVATRTPPITGAPAGLINRASAGAVTGVPA